MNRCFAAEEVRGLVMEDGEDFSDASDQDFIPDFRSDESEDELEEHESPDDDDDDDDEEEEGEQNEKVVDVSKNWRSKNGKIMWSATHDVARHYIPPAIPLPGPTCYATARISSPESAFNLFFTEDMINLIVEMTNIQGNRAKSGWTAMTAQEMRTYLGLLILSGLYKSRHEATSSLWNKTTGRTFFAEAMGHTRFVHINRMLRFDDNLRKTQPHNETKMSPILELWRKWNSLLPRLFNLGRDVCIDEQLIAFKGRCSFRQYMPSKPAKYGLKIWALCDVNTAYAWKLDVYTGKPLGGRREKNLAMQVVLRLCDSLEGHTLTTDNFFTSFTLADELKKKKMSLVGTLRKNKAEIPLQLLKHQDRALLSSLFAFTKDKCLVSYYPKKGKNVLMLSTKHREAQVEDSSKKKPQIILDYNRCKGAVDHLDQACATYSVRRRAQRWPMCLFYHMVDVSCYNAFVLFTEINPDWNPGKLNKRRLFLEELGMALIEPEMLRRGPLKTQGLQTAEATPGPAPKRKQCGLCDNPLRACNVCSKCGISVCRKHMRPICMNC
ncbi:piggyBac transposable element-derived protein 4-like [Dunckerocampus dactyliophorus]|uniref:piggyBac transposable element-derived protein 4-like n=1 Tax=Dunckerocampus dactyliophorus TaxID=161453 RepID=UPI002404B7D7|nr:piggyBac transposable element-derived protein 4-like [Dunckerocampus dactyliophorus]